MEADMQLSEIRIQNYRLLIDAKLDVDAKTTLIVGRNNTAKTSCGSCISTVLEGKDFSYNDYPLSKREHLHNLFLQFMEKKMSYEERVEFVESLFSVIKDLTEDDTINFGDSIFTFILRFRKVLKTKSEETKRVIYSIFGKDNPSKEEPIKLIPIKNKDKK